MTTCIILVLLICSGLRPCTFVVASPIGSLPFEKPPNHQIRQPQRKPLLRSIATHRVQHKGTVVTNIKPSNSQKKERQIEINNSSWLLGLCFPLWLAYISNQWSRSSIYYLVDFSDQATPFKAMNLDLHFSEAQYGVLASVAFTFLFAIASLLAGGLSDRYNRKLLTVASVATWGLATLGTSLSTSYQQVVGWRIIMGLSCAFSTPTAYTLLAERVPKDKKALSTSLYSTGVALGGALGSLSILLDSKIGWRATALSISLFALATAILNLLVLPDDPKERSKASASEVAILEVGKTSAIDEVRQVLTSSIRVQFLLIASFFRFCSGLLIGVWSAPYFRIAFPDSIGSYAVAQAAMKVTCSTISGILGGAAADRLKGQRQNQIEGCDQDEDRIGRQLWVPVVGSLLAIPAWYLSISSGHSFKVAMVWLAIEHLVAECWLGPAVSVLQASVNPKIGGTSQGLLAFCGALGNLAPSILGLIYEHRQVDGIAKPECLTNLLAVSVGGCYFLSAIFFGASAVSWKPWNCYKNGFGGQGHATKPL